MSSPEAMVPYEEAVRRDPDVMGGTLCFSGSRVPVRKLFDYLEGGHTIEYFLDAFDWIDRGKVLAVLTHSADVLEDLAS